MSGVDAATFVSIQCSVCHGQIRLGDERCPACGRALTEDERRRQEKKLLLRRRGG
jgi:predicted amidophosphoribosyltransferase